MASTLVTNLVGYTAAVLGTVFMLPQVVKLFETKESDEVSITMVVLYVLNCLLWLAYGFLISAMPLIVANGIALVIGLLQLFLKLKYE